MISSDAGWRVKLDRAVELLPQVSVAITDFIYSHPYKVSIQKDTQTGRFFANATLTAEPPPRLSAMVGEVIHNQRSSLALLINHLICQVSAPTRSTEFPICDSPTAFRSYQKNRRLDPKCGLAKIDVLGQSIKDTVEQLQPYQDPSNPLWVLHNLNNLDKHRNLIAVGTPVGMVQISLIGSGDSFHGMRLPGWNPAQGPLRQGSLLLSWDMGYGPPDLSVTRKVRPSLDVVFGQADPSAGRPVIQTLEGITVFIRDRVFTALEPYA